MENSVIDQELEVLCKNVGAKSFAIIGRKYVNDTGKLQISVELTPPGSVKRKDYLAIVCSDSILLSHHKKGTFNRRGNDILCISMQNLEVKHDGNAHVLELTCIPPISKPMEKLYTNETKYIGQKQKLRLHLQNQESVESLMHVIQQTRDCFNVVADGPPIPPRPKSLKRIAKEIVNKNKAVQALKVQRPAPPPPPSQETTSAPTTPTTVSRLKKAESSSSSRERPISYNSAAGDQTSLQHDEAKEEVANVFEGLIRMSTDEGTTSIHGDVPFKQVIETLREIVVTESKYVEDMGRLTELYMRPLQHQTTFNTDGSEEQMMSNQDIKYIFGSVRSIENVNTELLAALQKGVVDTNDQQLDIIGRIVAITQMYAQEFVRIIHFFKMYSIYCHQYTKALGKLSMLRDQSKSLDTFLTAIETKPENQQYTLTSLLIKPVQRICKYPLLFRELLKSIQKLDMENNDSFKSCLVELEAAKDAIDSIAQKVNEQVSDAEERERVLGIFNELGGEKCEDLVDPKRRVVGTFDVQISDQPLAEGRQGRVYLFWDLIIFGKSTSTGLANVGAKVVNNALGVKPKKPLQRFKVMSYVPLNSRCKITFIRKNDNGQLCLRFAQSGIKYWLSMEEDMAQTFTGEFQEVVNRLIAEQEKNFSKKKNTRSWTRSLRKHKATSLSRGGVDRASLAEQLKHSKYAKGGSMGQDALATVVNAATQAEEKENNQAGVARSSRHSVLALEELRSKYEEKVVPLPEDGVLKMSVDFPEGQLGIALQNSDQISGVLVSFVRPTSVAAQGGVNIGDRVFKINDVDIQVNAKWEEAIEVIKKAKRPLTISFERTQQTIEFADRKMRIDKKLKQLEAGMNTEKTTPLTIEESEKKIRLLCQDAACVFSGLAVKSTNDDGEEIEDEHVNQVIVLLNDVFETEVDHVCNLQKLIRHFLLAIRTEREKGNEVMAESDEAQIFLNIEMVYQTNCELLKTWSDMLLTGYEMEKSIGEVICAIAVGFRQISQFLQKSYGFFCSRYTIALDALTKLRKDNTDLDEFLQTKEHMKGIEPLSLYLLKPVHRISKYMSVFEKMLENLMECKSKFQYLNESLIAVKGALGTAKTCNAEIENNIIAAESQEKINEILVQLGAAGTDLCEDLFNPSNHFIRTEDVSIRKAPFGSAQYIPCRMYVFKDIILVAKPRHGSTTETTETKNNGTFGKRLGSFGKGSVSRLINNNKTVKATHKLLYKLEVGKCTLRDIPPLQHDNLAGHRFGFEIKHVIRVVRSGSVTGILPFRSKSNTGSAKIATSIEKYEIRLKNEVAAKGLTARLNEVITLKNEEQRTTKVQGGARRRSWRKKSISEPKIEEQKESCLETSISA